VRGDSKRDRLNEDEDDAALVGFRFSYPAFCGDPSAIGTNQHVASIINSSRTYSPRAGKENTTAKHKLDLLACNDFYAAFYLFPFPGTPEYQLRQFPANIRSSRVRLVFALYARTRDSSSRSEMCVIYAE